MKIFICDDEPQMLSELVKKVSECLPVSDIRGSLSGQELLYCLKTEPYDIMLLDIDILDITRLEIARLLSQKEDCPLLLFVQTMMSWSMTVFSTTLLHSCTKAV